MMMMMMMMMMMIPTFCLLFLLCAMSKFSDDNLLNYPALKLMLPAASATSVVPTLVKPTP